MARYRMSDGAVVDTEKATKKWGELRRFDGRNQVSVHTGDQLEHEKLYKSAKGRYYLESWSQWQGSEPTADFITDEDAARWLLLNEDPLPDDLAHLKDDLVE